MIILEKSKRKFITLRTTNGATYKAEFRGITEDNFPHALILFNTHLLGQRSDTYSFNYPSWVTCPLTNKEAHFPINNLIYYYETEEDVEEAYKNCEYR